MHECYIFDRVFNPKILSITAHVEITIAYTTCKNSTSELMLELAGL